MADQKKFRREELAAELEAKAKALRDDQISDEDVEKMAAGVCCGGCTVLSWFTACVSDSYAKCTNACVKSSPG